MIANAVTNDDTLRKARVFVSSTFRDMHNERDAINSIVFPFLRAQCAIRYIDFTGIDFRWGITEEQSREGQTVGICLSEVKRCNFFIGILGERYGWVPDPEYTKEYPKLFESEISVTEAEMEYGVFSRAPGESEAIFCLRDKSLSDAFGFAECDDSVKLKALKNRIRAGKSAYPLIDSYSSIEELCDFLKTHLLDAILAKFPPVRALNKYETEKQAQSFFINRLKADYCGRIKQLEKLNALAEKGGKPLLVTSKAGCGKSALLAQWVKQYQERHKDDFVFAHFTDATSESGDWEFLIRRLFMELSEFTATDFDIPLEKGELLSFTQKALSSVSDKKIVIVIDGLDGLSTDPMYGIAWLPQRLPAHVRLIVSAKGKTAKMLDDRDYGRLTILPLSAKEQILMADTYLDGLGKKLGEAEKSNITKRLCATPLFLKTLLSELCLFGDYDKLNVRINYYLKANSVTDLFRFVIERLEGEYADESCPNLVRDFLTTVICTRKGISEDELMAITDAPAISFFPLLYALKAYLITREGLIQLASKPFAQAVQRRYLTDKKIAEGIRKKIVKYFENSPDRLRSIDETTWQYYKMNQWTLLYKTLSSTDALLLSKQSGVLFKKYWASIEAKRALRRNIAYKALCESPDCETQTLILLAEFLLETGYYADAIKALENALKRDKDSQEAYGLLGRARNAMGDVAGAADAYYMKLEICTQTRNRLESARTLGNLGTLEYERHNKKAALDNFEKAKEECASLGFLHGKQAALGNIGKIYFEIGKAKEAKQNWSEQLILCRESGNLSGESSALGNLGVLYLYEGNADFADKLFSLQEAITKRTGNLKELEEVCGLRAVLETERGSYEKAEDLLFRQLHISREIVDYKGECAALENLLRLYKLIERPEDAISMGNDLADLHEKHNDEHGKAKAWLYLAQLYCEAGLEEEASGFLISAIKSAANNDYDDLYDMSLEIENKYFSEA
ncbi:MAG: DUF4062 domain-containing protein [Lachnospiraceae bacterium]|nr:DUF4062 domain-containing protein [Lachnospiraceae bacterium]